ncbi:MAG: hypothetical protein ABIX01_11990 [Chitinophagaceae bacterium]
MEDLELKQMWQAYDQKLDRLLVLNLRNFEELQTQKASAKINGFVRQQLVYIIIGVIWVAFLAILVFNTPGNLWFAVSLGGIILFSAYATILYIRHVLMLRQINFNGNITETQEQLAAVRASLNQVGRVLWLQTVFYCTWFINPTMYQNITGMTITFGIAAVFLAASIWMYQALAPKNMHRKWVRNFETSVGGKAIVEASEFLQEIEAFKQENN